MQVFDQKNCGRIFVAAASSEQNGRHCPNGRTKPVAVPWCRLPPRRVSRRPSLTCYSGSFSARSAGACSGISRRPSARSSASWRPQGRSGGAEEGVRCVGGSAGASTPEFLVEQLVERLALLHGGEVDVRSLARVDEGMTFKLPAELRD